MFEARNSVGASFHWVNQQEHDGDKARSRRRGKKQEIRQVERRSEQTGGADVRRDNRAREPRNSDIKRDR